MTWPPRRTPWTRKGMNPLRTWTQAVPAARGDAAPGSVADCLFGGPFPGTGGGTHGWRGGSWTVEPDESAAPAGRRWPRSGRDHRRSRTRRAQGMEITGRPAGGARRIPGRVNPPRVERPRERSGRGTRRTRRSLRRDIKGGAADGRARFRRMRPCATLHVPVTPARTGGVQASPPVQIGDSRHARAGRSDSPTRVIRESPRLHPRRRSRRLPRP